MAVDAIKFVSLFLPARDRAEAEWRPATDIYRVPDGWLVKMELAGVCPNDVQLVLRGRSLTVQGRRRDDCHGPDCRQLHMEIAYSRFERQIDLPADLTSARFETQFRDGLLLIRIRREG